MVRTGQVVRLLDVSGVIYYAPSSTITQPWLCYIIHSQSHQHGGGFSVASDPTAVKSLSVPPLLATDKLLNTLHSQANFSSQELIWDAQVMNSSVREYLQALTILQEKDELYRVLQMTKPISQVP